MAEWQLPRPTCAVCKAPVAEMEISRNEQSMLTIVVVRCHGAVEVVTLTDETFAEAWRITGGEAFVPKPAPPEGETPALEEHPRWTGREGAIP